MTVSDPTAHLADLSSIGLIYRQDKPVLWSPSSRTALAEAEIEYKDDHVSETAYVRFPIHTQGTKLAKLVSSTPSLADKQLNLVIWTTTPWTLPANMVSICKCLGSKDSMLISVQFVAYGKEIEYCITQNGQEYLIVAKDRLAALSQLLGTKLNVEASFEGRF